MPARGLLRSGALVLIAILSTALGAGRVSAQELVLRHHQGKGDKAKYDFACATKARMDLDQGLVASAADMLLQMKVLVEFSGADSPSHQDVCGQILSGQLKIKAAEGEETIAFGEGVVNYEISPLGEIRRAALLAGNLPILPGIWLIFGPDDAFLLGGTAIFPDRPVKKGDKWQGVARVPNAVNGQVAEIRYQSTVLAQEQLLGRPCLKIKTTRSAQTKQMVPIPGTAAVVQAKMTMTGSVIWRFDYERGLIVKADADDKLSIALRLEDPDSRTSDLSFTAGLKYESKLTEYNGKKVGAG